VHVLNSFQTEDNPLEALYMVLGHHRIVGHIKVFWFVVLSTVCGWSHFVDTISCLWSFIIHEREVNISLHERDGVTVLTYDILCLAVLSDRHGFSSYASSQWSIQLTQNTPRKRTLSDVLI